jgi:hypothetical protein
MQEPFDVSQEPVGKVFETLPRDSEIRNLLLKISTGYAGPKRASRFLDGLDV